MPASAAKVARRYANSFGEPAATRHLAASNVVLTHEPVFSGISYRGDKGTLRVKPSTKPGGTIVASGPDGAVIGALTWSAKRMQVSMVAVAREWQHQGIATRLWREAKKHAPMLQHADRDDQTTEGAAWAQVVD